jgi:hypothetical protein
MSRKETELNVTSTPNKGDSTMNEPRTTTFKSPFAGKNKAECIALFSESLSGTARRLYRKMVKVATEIENARLEDLRILNAMCIYLSCHCPLHTLLCGATERELRCRWEIDVFESGKILEDPEASFDEYLEPNHRLTVTEDREKDITDAFDAMTQHGRHLYDDLSDIGYTIGYLDRADLRGLRKLAMFTSIHSPLYTMLYDAPERALERYRMNDAIKNGSSLTLVD